MSDTIEFNIEALPVKIDYVGEVPSKWGDIEKQNLVDQWRVSINTKAGFWSTDYFTGTGLRREVKGSRAMHVKTYKTVGNKWIPAEPVKPTIADVLYSLFNDAQAADLNFHDWCDTFGMSDDSIKALNTYKQCLEIGTMLRKHFSPDQREAIQSIIADM
jgi:hypothetical protein